jgi:hypothetical protein
MRNLLALRERRARTGAVLILMSSIALLGVTASPAKAAQPDAGVKLGNYSVSYSATWKWVSPPFAKHGIDRCMDIKVFGKFTYTLYAEASGRAVFLEWKNQKLNTPDLTVTVHRENCKRSARLTEAKPGQYWAGYSCSFNPSISVTAPWGVGIGLWPSCGSRTQASYVVTIPGRNSTYNADNSGSPSVFGDYTTVLGAAKPPCYGVYVSLEAFAGTSVDSFGEGNIQKTHEVCLNQPKKYVG